VMDLKPWLPKGTRLYGLLAVLLVCSFLLSPVQIAGAGETEVLILHTNNVTGYLFPCPT
jgi:hypothetical protein